MRVNIGGWRSDGRVSRAAPYVTSMQGYAANGEVRAQPTAMPIPHRETRLNNLKIPMVQKTTSVFHRLYVPRKIVGRWAYI
ncbi:unnamed protein product, partial [Brenthis ino]